MKWLIAANSGYHFKYLAIDGFDEYAKRGKESINQFTNQEHRKIILMSDRGIDFKSYFFMYHIVTTIHLKRYYFLNKIKKVKNQMMPMQIKKNYLWIERILNEYDLEFMFCPNDVFEQRVAFKQRLRELRRCDNRMCHKKHMSKWYICKRC